MDIAMDRERIQGAFFLVLLAVLTAAFARLLAPLLVALMVAVILAVLARHPFALLTRRWGLGRGLATVLILVALLVLVSVPLLAIGLLVTAEIEQAVSTIRAQWPELLAWGQRTLPGLQALAAEYQLEQRVSELVGNAATRMLGLTQAVFAGAASLAVSTVVVVYVVIYLLRDGDRLVEHVHRLLPLDRARSRELMRKAARTLDATVVGTVVIGVIEGTFGGLLFLVFGFTSPTLWGLVMIVASVLPLLGINAVIVPAGIIAIVLGDVGRGVGLMVVGVAGATLSQNVLRPRLVGDRSGLHPALVLVSTLGGLAWLGLVGFLVGPVIATLFLVAWEQFASRRNAGS